LTSQSAVLSAHAFRLSDKMLWRTASISLIELLRGRSAPNIDFLGHVDATLRPLRACVRAKRCNAYCQLTWLMSGASPSARLSSVQLERDRRWYTLALFILG
jgi:hypothetical protein